PETTHDLVTWRLAGLTAHARDLLNVLAVANQPLPFELLAEFPGIQGDSLLPTLEDLVARGMLRETSRDYFALAHNLLRETLLHHISHLRRQMISRQLAVILETCPALQQNFPLRQLALHAVNGEDVERTRRFGLQILDELAQDNANMQTAIFLQHLHDLLTPTASTEEKLRLSAALGQVYQSLGRLGEAEAWRRRYLELAYKLPDVMVQSIAHCELGELALIANDYQAAAQAARAGLAVPLSAQNPQHIALIARGHRLLGAALAMEGRDLPVAEIHLQEAVTAHKHTNNTSDLCATLFELGNVAAQRGELILALDRYEEAARTAEVAHSHYFLALAHNNFAYHSLLLGRPEAARSALAKGQKLAETYEMFGALLHLASTQGEIHLYLGEWAAASEAFQHGLTLAEELGNLERQAGYRAGLALVARGEHKLREAVALLGDALILIAERGFWHLRTRIQIWLAETLILCGRSVEAQPHLDEALEIARTHGRVLLLIQGERLQARLRAIHGDWHVADKLFASAIERATRLNLALEIARGQAAWGKAALLHAMSPHRGHELLAAARKGFAAHGARAEREAINLGIR
ncbi:MAG: hypothetical protein J2P36_24110, partial [Ktedonobacteraceae bacterium]|nr:hypothetical protein [Ktedonobacteraceae bacterium]